MPCLEIDGRSCDAADGETILEVATRNGIRIPTLCHHAGLEPYGACRMCLVEVTTGRRTKLESSCTRPVEDGMVVRTSTAEVVASRRLTAELLAARCPDSEKVREVAREVGADPTKFEPLGEECMLCGLCVRACRDAMGTSAIGFVNRGTARRVGPPFLADSEACVGCGACAQVCPTGAIRIEDVGGRRYLKFFKTELELERCAECGALFAPKRFLEKTGRDNPAAPELRGLCGDCRRNRAAGLLGRRATQIARS